MPRPKPPKLTSPDERRKLVDIEDKRRFGPALVAKGIAYDDDRWAEAVAVLKYRPALAVLHITPDDEQWPDAVAMLAQVAEIYLVAAALEAEETPGRQREKLEARKRWVKAPPGGKKSCQPPPPLSMALEMDIARELPAIERATPGLSNDAKWDAARDAVIARLDARASRLNSNGKKVPNGRQQDWPLRNMIDRLLAVADDLDPSIGAPRERKRLREFISAFMEHAMGMKAPEVDIRWYRPPKIGAFIFFSGLTALSRERLTGTNREVPYGD